MRFANLRNFYCLLAAIALAAQIIGLVFCGDIDCLQGGPDENCAALICSLLGNHASTNPSAGDSPNNPCQCYCHVLVDLPKIALDAVLLEMTPFHLGETRLLVSAPVHDIDHPPLV